MSSMSSTPRSFKSLGGALTNVLRTNPFLPLTYGFALVGATVGASFISNEPMLVLLVAALLCGWAEIDGLCGTSHVSALTPLRALDRSHRLWFRAMSAYTAVGIVTSVFVGAILSVLGLLLQVVAPVPQYLFAFAAIIAALLCLRELDICEFRLPQLHRQTEKMWAQRFGFVTGAAMWGGHIGLGFATVIRHGGLLAIGVCAMALEPPKAAGLLAVFWVGRTLPIWLTPAVTSDHADGAGLANLVVKPTTAYRDCAAAGLLCLTAAAAMLAFGHS